MDMVKIRIEIEEGWWFWPVDDFPTKNEVDEMVNSLGEQAGSSLLGECTFEQHVQRSNGPTLEIPKKLLDEYNQALLHFSQIHAQLELLYRVQERLTPHEKPEIPEHRKL